MQYCDGGCIIFSTTQRNTPCEGAYGINKQQQQQKKFNWCILFDSKSIQKWIKTAGAICYYFKVLKLH